MAKTGFPCLLALSAAFLPGLPATQVQTEPSAKIEGVVVDTVSGAPVRRAVVQLRFAGRSDAISLESADYAGVTGPDGAFHFDGLPPGYYTLTYSRTGFLLPRANMGYSALAAHVAAGETVRLRYGLIPQAVVSGRVVDDEGDPVERVQVHVLAFRYSGGIRRLTQLGEAGVTNDRGEYRVARLPAGKYYVQASLDQMVPGSALLASARTAGAAPMSYGSTFYPGVTDSAQAIRVELHAGQEAPGIDIPLQRSAMVRVTGRVIGPDGLPLSHASLTLISAQSHLPVGVGAPADEAGNFALKNVRTGFYVLRAISGSRIVSAPLNVNSTDILGFVAQASPPLSLRGSVTVENPTNNFHLASVSVNLKSADNDGTGASARATADGSFSLENLSPGRYFAEVLCASSGAYVQSITAGGEEVLGRDFDISSASSGLRIILRTDSATLSGTVESADNGAGPAERQGHRAVLLLAADPQLRGVNMVAPASISSKNSFSFSGVSPGDYLAMAFDDIDESQLQNPEFLSTLEPFGIHVQLSPGSTQTVTLKWSAWPQTAVGF